MIELLLGSEVLRVCKEKKQTIGAMMLERETEIQGKSKQALLADMQQQLTTMRLAGMRTTRWSWLCSAHLPSVR